jgi:hypothetical protein
MNSPQAQKGTPARVPGPGARDANAGDAKIEHALRTHLPRLFELRPVPDEFLRLVEAWSARRRVKSPST